MRPGMGEAKQSLREGDAKYGVEVRLCNRVCVGGTASLHLQNDLAWQLAWRLVPNIRHILQGGTLLGPFGHPQVFDGDSHLPAALAALLLLLLHANDLPSKRCHAIFRNLNLLRRAAAAVFALRRLGVYPA